LVYSNWMFVFFELLIAAKFQARFYQL